MESDVRYDIWAKGADVLANTAIADAKCLSTRNTRNREDIAPTNETVEKIS
jgi:hypothetical protein